MVIHAYSFDTKWMRYFLANDISSSSSSDEQDSHRLLSQRSTDFLFPASPLRYSSSRSVDYFEYPPSKRQPFGRKHHWDAYFGRRR